jgi:hypothetical protein
VNDGTPVVLAKIVVTSNYLPPHLSEKYPTLTLAELEGFIGDLGKWPVDLSPCFARSAVEALTS